MSVSVRRVLQGAAGSESIAAGTTTEERALLRPPRRVVFNGVLRSGFGCCSATGRLQAIGRLGFGSCLEIVRPGRLQASPSGGSLWVPQRRGHVDDLSVLLRPWAYGDLSETEAARGPASPGDC